MCFINFQCVSSFFTVPAEPPTHIEALLLNTTAVYLKWRAPTLKSQNGVLTQYFVIVRGVDIRENASRILTNVTLDATTPSLMLANLTWGVTYTVSIAAGNFAGLGPFSSPAPLRLDPRTRKLDQSFGGRRYPMDVDAKNTDFMTETWFIVLLAGMLTVIVLLTCFMVGYARKKYTLRKEAVMNGCPATLPHDPKQMMKQSATSRSGFWCDPETTLWRPPSHGTMAKGMGTMTSIPDYGPIDSNPYQDTRSMKRNAFGYKEFGPSTEYAEVSSFRKGPSSEYGRTQSPAPYATTRVDNDGQLNTKFATSYEQRMPRLSTVNPDLIMLPHQHTMRTRPECAYSYAQQEYGRQQQPIYNGAGSIHSEMYYNPMEQQRRGSCQQYERECHNNLRNLTMGPAPVTKCSTFSPGENVRTHHNPHSSHQHNHHRFKITPNFAAMNNFDECQQRSKALDGNEQLYVKVAESNADGDDDGERNWNMQTTTGQGGDNLETIQADRNMRQSLSSGKISGMTATMMGLMMRRNEDTIPQPV